MRAAKLEICSVSSQDLICSDIEGSFNPTLLFFVTDTMETPVNAGEDATLCTGQGFLPM